MEKLRKIKHTLNFMQNRFFLACLTTVAEHRGRFAEPVGRLVVAPPRHLLTGSHGAKRLSETSTCSTDAVELSRSSYFDKTKLGAH